MCVCIRVLPLQLVCGCHQRAKERGTVVVDGPFWRVFSSGLPPTAGRLQLHTLRLVSNVYAEYIVSVDASI